MKTPYLASFFVALRDLPFALTNGLEARNVDNTTAQRVGGMNGLDLPYDINETVTAVKRDNLCTLAFFTSDDCTGKETGSFSLFKGAFQPCVAVSGLESLKLGTACPKVITQVFRPLTGSDDCSLAGSGSIVFTNPDDPRCIALRAPVGTAARGLTFQVGFDDTDDLGGPIRGRLGGFLSGHTCGSDQDCKSGNCGLQGDDLQSGFFCL